MVSTLLILVQSFRTIGKLTDLICKVNWIEWLVDLDHRLKFNIFLV